MTDHNDHPEHCVYPSFEYAHTDVKNQPHLIHHTRSTTVQVGSFVYKHGYD